MRLRLEFNPNDFWIGIRRTVKQEYRVACEPGCRDRSRRVVDLCICPLPMLALHVGIFGRWFRDDEPGYRPAWSTA